MPLLLHRPKLRALLQVVALVTVHLLVVAAVIAPLLVVVLVTVLPPAVAVVIAPLLVVVAVTVHLLVAVLLLHLLPVEAILLGLVQRMVLPVPLIGKATIISLSKSSDIL